MPDTSEPGLASSSTCDLFDRFGDVAGTVGTPFSDYGGRLRFAGRAVTVRCFEDNSVVKDMVRQDGRGRVLVVDGGASLRCALLGDMIAEEARAHGWEGVVVFGAVRDRALLRGIDLGIKALGTTPRKSVRRGKGEHGVTLTMLDLVVRPDDCVFADEDGILVLPPSAVRE